MDKKRTTSPGGAHLFRLAAIVLTALLLSAAHPARAAGAQRTASRIYLNDTPVTMAGYNIGGSNYFRLRDLARALDGTSSSFDVTWNSAARCVEVTTGQAYSGGAEDGAQADTWYWGDIQAQPADARLMVDGAAVEAAAYTIGGSNYYQLRDLSKYLSFEVHWMRDTNAIHMYTVGAHALLAGSSGGTTRRMTAALSTERWHYIHLSHIYDDGGDVFYVVEAGPSVGEGTVSVDTYSRGTCELLGTQSVPVELERFGGFYAGEQYNYMVFGQDNPEEDDGKEVVRVVKYDKQFNRLAAASVNGGESFTIEPLRHGAVRMAESGSELTVHTSRKRYTTEDGLNHQSQLTLVLDTGTMRVKNSLGRYQDNHVSHSFNQFVQYDGQTRFLVDHGDAYPRSIVLNRGSGSSYTEVDLLKIPGEVGANCTGVNVGGFELSGSSCLVAINTIDHSKVTGYDSFSMTGLDRDERDIVLLVCGKNVSSAGGVRQVVLTDYAGRGKLGSTPYLVKRSEDRYVVLWEEFEYTEGSAAVSRGVRYVEVSGSGEVLTEVTEVRGAQLSADCQPVCIDGAVVWYVNMTAGRMFYRI